MSSSDADRELPPRVARALDYPFLAVSTEKWSSQRHSLWLEHTGDDSPKQIPGSNYFYFTHGYWAQLGYNLLTVEGQCYELGTNYYYPAQWNIPQALGARDALNSGTICSPEEFQLTKDFWDSLQIPLEIDDRDLLFWSYAINTVYSNLYQESDMWTDAVCPVNCRLLYSTLLSVSPSRREGKVFENLITTTAAPALRALPINPPNGLLRLQVDRWQSWVTETQRYGFPYFIARRFAGIMRRIDRHL